MKKISFLVLITVFLVACSSTETIETIEAYVLEEMEENDDGMYEVVGYKKVNAITIVEAGENHTKTETKVIEDFFDKEGNYLKTEVLNLVSNLSNVTQKIEDSSWHEELQEPSTVLLNDMEFESFGPLNLNYEDRTTVKNHVSGVIESLKAGE